MTEEPLFPDMGIEPTEDPRPPGYETDLHTLELTLEQIDLLSAGMGVMLGIYQVVSSTPKGDAMGTELFSKLLAFVDSRIPKDA